MEPIPALNSTVNCLVVDDRRAMANLYAEWVGEKWGCRTAYGGEAAFEEIGPRTDIVLLDREMPVRAGEDVLRSIRDGGYDVQVVMVSGVEPDVDLIDYPIDDYLEKPVDRPTLQGKVEELLVRRTYHPTIQRYFVAVAKLELLEETQPESELVDDDDYLALRATADELRQESNATLGSRSDHVADFTVKESHD